MQVLKSIETVCGPVPSSSWLTLAHEHFFTVTYSSRHVPADPEIAQLIEDAAQVGTQSVTDLTALYRQGS